MSQSPQTGQFNSYYTYPERPTLKPFPYVSIPSNGSIQFLPSRKVNRALLQKVSIPSNGSIQFLQNTSLKKFNHLVACLNPLKRVNSILTDDDTDIKIKELMSQSPQTGQFNSYKKLHSSLYALLCIGLNPLKRVNSILTDLRLLVN